MPGYHGMTLSNPIPLPPPLAGTRVQKLFELSPRFRLPYVHQDPILAEPVAQEVPVAAYLTLQTLDWKYGRIFHDILHSLVGCVKDLLWFLLDAVYRFDQYLC